MSLDTTRMVALRCTITPFASITVTPTVSVLSMFLDIASLAGVAARAIGTKLTEGPSWFETSGLDADQTYEYGCRPPLTSATASTRSRPANCRCTAGTNRGSSVAGIN